jgi:predicted alpha-1,2-mannosidase
MSFRTRSTLLIFFFITTLSADENLVQYVNPLIGTASNYQLSNGNTYPAITLPFGMTSWTPQTNEERWIYTYKADSLQGLRATHLPSPWISDYGSFSIMPLVGELTVDASGRASTFRHDNEVVSPYYYKVHLKRYNIIAELTSTMRCSYVKFNFPKSPNAYVVIDAHPSDTYIEIFPEENKVVGYTRSNNGGVPENFACYFVAFFDKSFSSFGTWMNREIYSDNAKQEGKHVGAFLNFTTDSDESINLRVGTSFISIEQAEKNLENEIGKKSFEGIRNEAKEIWNEQLSKVRIDGCSNEQRMIFYTALYRCQLFPRVWYEFDDFSNPIYFSPFDGKIHKGYMYTDTGFWDTFRTVFPLFTILFPERDSDIIRGLISAYEQGGWFPKWMSPGYRNAMTGTFVGSVVTDAYYKGIQNFDVEKAYEAMVKDAIEKSDEGGRGRVGIEYYTELGYVPADKVREATTRTLEFAYGDFCVAQLAKALNRIKDYEFFMTRAKNYKNVYDESTGFMRGRKSNSQWLEPFNPVEWGGPFTEGCAWHYTFSVPHDVQGLIILMGGKEQFINKMDELLSTPSNFVHVGSYERIIHEMTEMVLANMGQYAHGNQPVHNVLYLYNYAGEPWKTQKWVRKVMNNLYGPGPDGLPGDEDNGSMSSWYIFSSLGFYPVCPGVPMYVLGSPLFEKATINLPNGNTFIVIAKNNSRKNKYIQSANKSWIEHASVVNGGILEFIMGPNPNKNWASNFDSFPFSLSN